MFFIGATGQIITLILTVILPLFFFISAPSAEILKSGVHFEIQHISPSGDVESHFHVTPVGNSAAIISTGKDFVHFITSEKVPPVIIHLTGKSIYPGNNENKAPPALFV